MTQSSQEIPEPPRPEKVTFLYIDDNRGDRLLVQEALKIYEPDMRVLLAEDAATGFAWFEKLKNGPVDGNWRIDCVLVDLLMPVNDGTDVITRLRKDFPDSLLPVILVSSGWLTDGMREKLCEIGADAALSKPASLIEFETLFATIRKLADCYRKGSCTEGQPTPSDETRSCIPGCRLRRNYVGRDKRLESLSRFLQQS